MVEGEEVEEVEATVEMEVRGRPMAANWMPNPILIHNPPAIPSH